MCANGNIPEPGLRSEKALLENEDEALHEIDELTERWHHRLTFGNLRFVVRYLKDEVGIGIEVRFPKGHSQNLVAFFERERSIVEGQGDGRLGGLPRDLDPAEITVGRDNPAVLIDDVQLVQSPEGISLSSTVRLQVANDFFNLRTGSAEKCDSLVVGQARLLPTYWEVSFLDRRLRGDLASQMGASGNQTCCEGVE